MEQVTIHNPHSVPVDVPGYGLLAAGEQATVNRSARLRRALDAGRIGEGDAAAPEEGADAVSREYGSRTIDELQQEAERRGIDVQGTGTTGNVRKADLVTALERDDASA